VKCTVLKTKLDYWRKKFEISTDKRILSKRETSSKKENRRERRKKKCDVRREKNVR